MSRSRLPLLVTAAAALVLVVFAVQWAGVTPREIRLSDFTGTYVGATLLREGHGAGVYDLRLQASLHAALVAPLHRGNLPFVNPPVAAVLALPVSLLPLTAAFRVWQAAQLAMLLAAVLLVAVAAPWPQRRPLLSWPRVCTVMLALAGTATLALGLLGQWDGFSALGLAAAYVLWRRGRPGAGALVLSATALAAKPHLALGLAALMLGWRDRRVLAGALAGAAIVVAASLLAVGPAGIPALLAATRADVTLLPAARMLGLGGLAASWLGDGVAAEALTVAAEAAAVALCAVLGDRLRRRPELLEPCLAGATLLSLAASPHLLTHDPVLLAPALVWLTAWTSRRDALRPAAWPGPATRAAFYGWVLLNLAVAVDIGGALKAPPGRLTPLALLACAAALLRVTRAAGTARRAVALRSRRAS